MMPEAGMLAIVIWCSLATGVMTATVPHESGEASRFAEWARANPGSGVVFGGLILEGDRLWDAALRASDPKNPPEHCPRTMS